MKIIICIMEMKMKWQILSVINRTAIYYILSILYITLLNCGDHSKKYDLIVKDGHSGKIYSVAISPNSQVIASASEDSTIILWSLDGRVKNVLKGHDAPVNCIRFAPDGSYFVSGGMDNSIIIWSLNGQIIKRIENSFSFQKPRINDIALSNEKIISVSSDATIHVFSKEGDLENTKEIEPEINQQKSHKTLKYETLSLAVSKDKIIAVGDNFSNILLFDFNLDIIDILPEARNGFDSHTDWVQGLAFSPTNNSFISVGWDNRIILWNKNDNNTLCAYLFCPILINGGHSSFVNAVAFAPDGKRFITVSHDRKAIIWNEDGVKIKDMEPLQHGAEVSSVAASDSFIVTGSWDKSLRIWNKNGKPFKEAGSNRITSVAFNYEGSKIAFGSENGIGKVWDIGKQELSLMRGHGKEIKSFAFSPKLVDGKELLASASKDKSILIWDVGNLKEPICTISSEGKQKNGHICSVQTVTFSPDGKTLASGSDGDHIMLHDPLTCRVLKQFKKQDSVNCNSEKIHSIRYSEDGKTLAAAYGKFEKNKWVENSVSIWSNDGEFIEKLNCDSESGRVSSIAIIPKNQTIDMIVSGSRDNKLRYCKLGGEEPECTIMHNVDQDSKVETDYESVESVDYNTNVGLVASGAYDKTVKLWDTKGNLKKTLKGHTDRIRSIAFSPNGKLLVSGSNDNTIKLWNVTLGKNIFTLFPTNSNDFVIYTDDNYYFTTTNAIGNISVHSDFSNYSFEQFDLVYNRPDLILERIRTADNSIRELDDNIRKLKRYRTIHIAENGFTEENLRNRHVEPIQVKNIKINNKLLTSYLVFENIINLSFSLESNSKNIIGYQIYVNGIPMYENVFKEFKSALKKKDVLERIALSLLDRVQKNIAKGENKIEISGFTDDKRESIREEIYLNYISEKTEKPTLHLIGFASTEYNNDRNDLEKLVSPKEDIKKLFDELKIRSLRKYKEVKIHGITYSTGKKTEDKIFKDAEVTIENIENVRNQLMNTSVNDTVILFIAGHGIREKTNLINLKGRIIDRFNLKQIEIENNFYKSIEPNISYYVTTYSQPNKLWEHAIPIEAFRYLLDGIPPRQKLFLIGMCQAGELPPLNYEINDGDLKNADRVLIPMRNNRDPKSGKCGKYLKMGHYINDLDKSEDEKEKRIQIWNKHKKEINKYFPELRRGNGSIELSAVSGDDSAVEITVNGNYSLFAEAIMEAIHKDKNSVIDLRNSVIEKFKEHSNCINQTPMTNREIFDLNFFLY